MVLHSNVPSILEFPIIQGEFFDFLSDKEGLSEEEASGFMKQILIGLKHMHDKNVIHLDLKPENLMLKTPACHQIKLIDFGLSRKINPGEEIVINLSFQLSIVRADIIPGIAHAYPLIRGRTDLPCKPILRIYLSNKKDTRVI